ncbi:MAG: hypothetical protein ACM3UX_01625 [Candidatus Woesearchaeota archaeon]
MPVVASSFYGLIVRKTDRTRRLARELVFRPLREVSRHAPPETREDEHLISVVVAMDRQTLDGRVRDLERLGLKRGRDFVLTGSLRVIGPRPPWLSTMLGPTGNPPELEARMEPEVREMWEQTRQTLYFLTPGHEEGDA